MTKEEYEKLKIIRDGAYAIIESKQLNGILVDEVFDNALLDAYNLSKQEGEATIENLASQVVKLQAELTRLKDENSMLLERINNG